MYHYLGISHPELLLGIERCGLYDNHAYHGKCPKCNEGKALFYDYVGGAYCISCGYHLSGFGISEFSFRKTCKNLYAKIRKLIKDKEVICPQEK